MSTLGDINFDLLKIINAEKTGNLLDTLPTILAGLEDLLDDSSLTSLYATRIQTAYTIVNSPFFIAVDGFHDPNLNYITISGDAGSFIMGGFGKDILLGGLVLTL